MGYLPRFNDHPRERIERDSLVAVQLINEGNPNGNHQQALVADAQILMARTGAVLSHIYRQANQTADHLARMGAEQLEELVVTDSQRSHHNQLGISS